MRLYRGLFDVVDLEEACAGEPIIHNEKSGLVSIVVPVVNMAVFEHPLNLTVRLKYFDKSYLFFSNVKTSKRRLSPCAVDGKFTDEFKEITDVSIEVQKEMDVFYLSGVDVSGSCSALDWLIEAEGFTLAVPLPSRESDLPWLTNGENSPIGRMEAQVFLESAKHSDICSHIIDVASSGQ